MILAISSYEKLQLAMTLAALSKSST